MMLGRKPPAPPDNAAAMRCTAAHHGTTWAYARYGCQCDEAVARVRAASRARASRLPRGTRRHGRFSGYDPVAVARACAGEKIPLTTPEMTAAVHILRRRGYSIAQTAMKLGTSTRTVNRHRAAARQPDRQEAT